MHLFYGRSMLPHVQIGPNDHQENAPHFTFLYFEMPLKAFDRAFTRDGQSIFFLKGLKIECHQSRSFFSLTIDVTCLCSGIPGLLCWKSFFFRKISFLRHVQKWSISKKLFLQQRYSGLCQNKGRWPIFKRRITDFESLRFLDISEKMFSMRKSLSNPYLSISKFEDINDKTQ